MALPLERTCPATGLRLFSTTETLVKINAVVAVVFLLLGFLWVIPSIINRVLGPGVVSPQLYYQATFLHGWNMLIFWILFFEVALLYFAASALLKTPLRFSGLAWGGFWLMLLGAVLINYLGVASPSNFLPFTPYVPLQAPPLFYLAVILFAVGAILAVFVFFATLHRAWREKTYGATMPLGAFGALTAAILATTTLLSGAIAFIPTFLWSLGWLKVDPLWFRHTYWGFGHGAQQVNLAAMVTVWYLLALFTVGGTTPSERLSRIAFLLYLLGINLGSAHHLLTEPTGALSSAWTWVNTGYLIHVAVLGSLIHAFSVPAAIERGLRLKGFTQGLFGWLARAPWGNPGFSALVLSVILFGFLGGMSGVTMGSYDQNLKWHNTLAVVGHFKGTVVAGTSLAFMGLTYYLLPLIFRRKLIWPRLAAWQPWLFGLGMGLLSLAMLRLGVVYGLPRRSGDTFQFGGSPFAFPYPPEMATLLAAMGIGGTLALLGGLLFVLLAVSTLLWGKPLTDEEIQNTYQVKAEEGHATPKGVYLLALLFLAFFLIYYLYNHWFLSQAWLIGGR
ncbi:cbb3-type cytochrome c oxidase subunit I [Thermus antranikianii]|uniref:cbb3-type cytochrome c oxidase subunit I n=1 Tax=Thermus antranikianii TaxID=88190 RepID=UPI001C751E7A|nr:cbb3-type cytochrome c oxidase subunit I [Thermus antranikianii]QWK21988.1 MAG: cbb3-type cytochrome c oxidase subunit I [Thermus antranikianii]